MDSLLEGRDRQCSPVARCWKTEAWTAQWLSASPRHALQHLLQRSMLGKPAEGPREPAEIAS